MKEDLYTFEKQFGVEPTAVYFSPGRVNLIGEHTDYSGGFVFPMALSLGITGFIKPRKDDRLRIYSDTFPELGIITIDKDDLAYKPGFSFGNYVQGVLHILKEAGYHLERGFDLYMKSSLPASAGLSSSAALEMLLFEIINDTNEFDLRALDKVKLAKKVENEYMNVSSGIMDQYAVQFGKKDHALFLDTHTLKLDYAPIDFNKVTLLLMNTNKRRNLEESDYNERFESVKKGTKIIQRQHDVEVLGQLDINSFEQSDHGLNDPLLEKRIRHVVSENDRTKKAFDALKNNDMIRFGTLMNASHESLKHDFEVSCAELDFLVEANLKSGALGARMTGAGFGGTMIAIYEKDKLPASFDDLKTTYRNTFNKKLDIYIAASSDGAKRIKGDV